MSRLSAIVENGEVEFVETSYPLPISVRCSISAGRHGRDVCKKDRHEMKAGWWQEDIEGHVAFSDYLL
jgi:hypothetical protein